MEEQRFSDEVAFSLELPAKTVRLLGTEVLFPGSYFVERYTNEFFHGKFTALGQDIEQQIQALELDGDSIATNIRAAVVQNGIDDGIREIEEFASSVGLDSGTENEIVSQYQALILAFGDQIEEVGPLFAQIDAGVDDAILRGEYKKALRPRVQSYGVGLTGLAKAVATQSVLNAGIGLAYSAANKANTGFVKSTAQAYFVTDPKTKSGVRSIPLSDAAYLAFARVIQNRKAPKVEMIVDGCTGFLFLDKDGRPKVAMHLQNYMKCVRKKYVEKYGNTMPSVTPHVLRHTFCTNLQPRIDVKSLQYLMGHSNASVTLDVYSHSDYDTVERAFLDAMKPA